MVDSEIILTPEGFQRLKEEIDYLSTKKRDEVAERISDVARLRRHLRELRVRRRQERAGDARAAHLRPRGAAAQRHRHRRGRLTTETVGVGTKVTLQDMQRGDVVQYAIVGSAEADPTAHKLSNESPVGRAIMGHKPGDKVTVSVPQGSKKLKVLAIEKA